MSDGNDVWCMLEILESSTNSDADPKKIVPPKLCKIVENKQGNQYFKGRDLFDTAV